MFHQLLTPISGSLPLSFLVAVLPIVVVLVMLGVLRRPAWQASLAGLIVAFVIAVTAWQMPAGLAVDSAAAGAVSCCVELRFQATHTPEMRPQSTSMRTARLCRATPRSCCWRVRESESNRRGDQP
mgnify:CR=1 FL=1